MSIKCPKCESENIHIDKKGFSGTKAVAGAVLAGPVGMLAGTHGSGNIICNCLDCGNKWDNAKLIKEAKSQEIQKQIKSTQENKKLFYHYYEIKDYDNARKHLSKFDSVPNGSDLSFYYKKWKDDDRLKNWLMFGAMVVILFLTFLFVKSCS